MRPSDLIRKIENALIGPKRQRVAPTQASAPMPALTPAQAAAGEMKTRLATLRAKGVRIGEGCMIFTDFFSTEPYLVDIGDRVGISGGVKFLTHDASVWLIRPERPDAQVLGRIRVGDGTFIGENSIILPGTTIGQGCVIAAGAVVRGDIPDDSIVVGNPGEIVGQASMLNGAHILLGRVLDTFRLPEPEREAAIRKHFGL